MSENRHDFIPRVLPMGPILHNACGVEGCGLPREARVHWTGTVATAPALTRGQTLRTTLHKDGSVTHEPLVNGKPVQAETTRTLEDALALAATIRAMGFLEDAEEILLLADEVLRLQKENEWLKAGRSREVCPHIPSHEECPEPLIISDEVMGGLSKS